jgi:tetratricopeptide (TPR) repeat protein
MAAPAGGGAGDAAAEAHRAAGNASFRAGRHAEAVASYGAALALAPSAALFSNRSASHAALCDWACALADADAAVAMQPSWAKAHARRAAALHGLCRFADAAAAASAAAAAAPPGSDDATATAASAAAAKRRAALLLGGAPPTALVCDASTCDDELRELLLAARGSVRRLDAVDAPNVTAEGVLTALQQLAAAMAAQPCELRVALMNGLDAPSRAALARVAPGARVECVTDCMNAAAALRAPPTEVIAAALAPAAGHPTSFVVQTLAGMLVGCAAFCNQEPAGDAGAAEVLVAALRTRALFDVPAAHNEHAARLLLALCGLQNVAAGAPRCQARAAAAGATAAVAAHIAAARFAHRADITMALFGALNALKRPADALAASPSILVALHAALRRHGATHAECAQRLLVQVRNLAGVSADAAATLGTEGFVEAVIALTDVASPAVCRCAATALAALTSACAPNAARAAAEASGEAALALAPLFAQLEAAEREMASPSGFDAKAVERTGATLRAASSALPAHLAGTPRGLELAARAAHVWGRAAMATDGDMGACCDAFRAALAHARAHPGGAMGVVGVLLPYGQALCQLGRVADAEALLRQALELCNADEAANGRHAWAVCGALGNTMLQAGRLDEALSLWAGALSSMRAAP